MLAILIGVTCGVIAAAGFAWWKWFDARISGAPAEWSALPRGRRREIRKMLLRGQQVAGSPEEARMAGDVAALLLRSFSGQRIALTLCLVLGGAAYWVVLAARSHHQAWVILTVVYLVIAAQNVWRWRRTAARLREAFAANYAAAAAS